jgi:hypothetical protein
MKAFRVTYEIITTESAEHGDVAKRGYVSIYGRTARSSEMTLREALNLVGCLEDSGSWFSETDGRDDYRTGAHERRDLHPPHNITAASYSRLKRLLKA